MNAELLRKADPEVRRAYEDLRDLNGVLERSLALAIAAYLQGTPSEDLPGSPPSADDRLEWLDYWVGQGALVFHEQLPIEA
jgi:hypothetical protein